MSDWSFRVPFFGERDGDIGIAIARTRVARQRRHEEEAAPSGPGWTS